MGKRRSELPGKGGQRAACRRNGTLQILTGQVNYRILGSARVCNRVEVNGAHRYAIDRICLTTSEEGRTNLKSGKFIRFYGTGDEFPVQISKGIAISLSAYMARADDPAMEYSDCSFGVALSNHADFTGTLEYVKATKAKFVVADNTRGHGAELAVEVTRRLGISARPSSTTYSREWGFPDGALMTDPNPSVFLSKKWS
jgi:hypothetical protein